MVATAASACGLCEGCAGPIDASARNPGAEWAPSGPATWPHWRCSPAWSGTWHRCSPTSVQTT